VKGGVNLRPKGEGPEGKGGGPLKNVPFLNSLLRPPGTSSPGVLSYNGRGREKVRPVQKKRKTDLKRIEELEKADDKTIISATSKINNNHDSYSEWGKRGDAELGEKSAIGP